MQGVLRRSTPDTVWRTTLVPGSNRSVLAVTKLLAVEVGCGYCVSHGSIVSASAHCRTRIRVYARIGVLRPDGEAPQNSDVLPVLRPGTLLGKMMDRQPSLPNTIVTYIFQLQVTDETHDKSSFLTI